MDPHATDLYQSLVRLVPAAGVLPPVALSGAERKALSGGTSRTAPRLVRAVCRALEDDPALFAELPVDAGALLARQERALAFFSLFAALQRLCRRAQDCYLHEQSRATSEALAVVHHGRHQRKGPFPSPRRRRLEDALRPAEAVLQAEHRRKE